MAQLFKRFFGFAGSLILSVGCATTPLRPPILANEQSGVLSKPDPKFSTDVVIVPQWHLSPSTTTTASSAGLPQAENQRAIYHQLVEWVEGGRVQTVVVEGCEGEINDGFTDRFNGWTLADLQRLTSEQLDNVMTQVGLKLKAKFGRSGRVLCGDKLDLVRKHQLVLSDMRGLLGFKLRIAQLASDDKTRLGYVESARDVLKMPAASTEADVSKRIDDDLRSKLDEFDRILKERDASFVSAVKAAGPVDAVVIGAIHISDLNQQLSAAKLTVQVFTPNGLKGDESELLGQVRTLLTK